MPGSSEPYSGRMRKVIGSGGSELGMFHLANDRDPDPTSRTIYICVGGREFPVSPNRDGICYAGMETTQKIRRYTACES